MNLEKFTQVAYSLIPTPRPRSFHVAGIFKKGKPLAIACNRDITHPRTLKYDYVQGSKTHAELLAIIRGRRDNYSGYTIVVLRIDRNRSLNMSRPCSGCMDAIRQLGFKAVYYTTESGSWAMERVSKVKVSKS